MYLLCMKLTVWHVAEGSDQQTVWHFGELTTSLPGITDFLVRYGTKLLLFLQQ